MIDPEYEMHMFSY